LRSMESRRRIASVYNGTGGHETILREATDGRAKDRENLGFFRPFGSRVH
jgi:hypothetical protein